MTYARDIKLWQVALVVMRFDSATDKLVEFWDGCFFLWKFYQVSLVSLCPFSKSKKFFVAWKDRQI